MEKIINCSCWLGALEQFHVLKLWCSKRKCFIWPLLKKKLSGCPTCLLNYVHFQFALQELFTGMLHLASNMLYLRTFMLRFLPVSGTVHSFNITSNCLQSKGKSWSFLKSIFSASRDYSGFFPSAYYFLCWKSIVCVWTLSASRWTAAPGYAFRHCQLAFDNRRALCE